MDLISRQLEQRRPLIVFLLSKFEGNLRSVNKNRDCVQLGDISLVFFFNFKAGPMHRCNHNAEYQALKLVLDAIKTHFNAVFCFGPNQREQ